MPRVTIDNIEIEVPEGTTILQAAIPNVVVASVPENRTSEAIGTIST